MDWFSGPIGDAIRTVKEQKTFLLVLVKGTDQESVNTHTAFDNERVREALKSCVCLCLEANSNEASQFSAIYSVVVVPSTYLIDSQGNPLEVLLGEASAERIDQSLVSRITVSTSTCSSEAAVVMNAPETESPQATVTAPTNQNATPSPTPQESSSSQVSLEERVLFARQRLEAKRIEKEKAEQERLREKEAERRENGKLMHNAKRTREEQAREDAIQERRKEIEADRLHREKIKRQLEDDKRERAARRGLVAPVADVGNNASVTPISPLSQRQGESSTSCRLQLRFPDGATFVHIFHSQDDTLHNVRQYIQQEARSMESQKFYKWVADGSFSLARTFPRQDFHGEDEARSLGDLGLSPSSALMVLPLSGSNVSSGGSGTIIASGGTLLNNVFLTVWRIAYYLFSFLTSILPFNTSSTSNTASASPRAGQNSAPGPSQDKGPKSSTDSQTQNSETRFRGEKRLHDLRRDDDDEATWNGNSTQQM